MLDGSGACQVRHELHEHVLGPHRAPGQEVAIKIHQNPKKIHQNPSKSLKIIENH